jgi:hypothetical protein
VEVEGLQYYTLVGNHRFLRLLVQHQTKDVRVEQLEQNLIKFVVFVSTIDLNLLERYQNACAQVCSSIVFSYQVFLDECFK